MPAPIMFAHQLGPRAHPHPQDRQGQVAAARTPRARSPSSYVNDQPVRITNVVISTQHSAGRRSTRRSRNSASRKSSRRVLPEAVAHQEDRVPDQPDRPVRRRRAAGRHRVDRPQDHRGQLRRHGPARRRLLQRQGPVQGGPQRGLHGPLRGEEHRRRGPGHERGDSVRLRHRLSRPGFGVRQHVRHRRR